MKRVFLVVALALTACSDSGQAGQQDAAADLSLPPQVLHLGVPETVCCIETTPSAWRVMYLAKPQPGGSDSRGNDIATKGELHIADAYGADQMLATDVPRDSYLFSADGNFILYMAPNQNSDGTLGLFQAALAADTLGKVTPSVVIPRGLDADRPLTEQAFFSGSGRYLIIGVSAPTIMNSSNLTVVDVNTATVTLSLPNNSFDYIEEVSSNDVLVFTNSTASKTVGVASVVGLYALPLATGSAAKPALIDNRTAAYAFSPDERRILYTKVDNTLWMYDLTDQSHVQLLSNVVNFTLGPNANGPIVWVDEQLAIHVTPILQQEIVHTGPNATTPFASFVFSSSGQDLYFFDRSSQQDASGDLYRLDLRPGSITGTPLFIDHEVSQSDFYFFDERVRYIRNLDTRGEVGDLVSAKIDGSDQQVVANGVPSGSIHIGLPKPIPPVPAKGNPPRGPIDMTVVDPAPVYAHLVNAARDTSLVDPLFDESAPIVGALAFSRANDPPIMLDPSVHITGYHFSPDGYVLAYAGGTTLNTDLEAYLGSLRLYQTLVDQAPVPPTLDGVSEITTIRERAFFAAAPGAATPGVYFVRY